ncbi:related to NTG1 - DNA repair protein [Melanopsichium pennsylvanicum]|uniref:Endonuclease III homolog n=1 Tax=Melanopsichium pennsylvanicum TaxID=63383 RepID=A0AAJ4XQS6_9BASI|nr:related to NTG1 - DNA repair protein [Melanopsichium pennsylvanicum]
MSAITPAVRASTRRKLFAPTPVGLGATANGLDTNSAGPTHRNEHTRSSDIEELDAVLAASLSATETRRSYSLRTRVSTSSSSTISPAAASTSRSNGQQKRGVRTIAAKRAREQSPSSASEPSDSAGESDFDAIANSASDSDGDVFQDKPSSKLKAKSKAYSSTSSNSKRSKTAIKKDPSDLTATSTPKRSRSKSKSTSTSPTKKPPASPFDVSPRKSVRKPWKINLDASEAHPAPPNWQLTYNLLSEQRRKIIAPVDTMGCEENGREDRRADSWRQSAESAQESAKRQRLSTLVSLMLSSQTKDPVTAEAVYNLQRNLPNGLCLTSLLEADDETISGCIAKVGFWRRKTGYLKSAARILNSDFHGDVPRTVDELCSLPGVGPKMAFLALSSMGIQVGIGVDTHVHRMTNRLGWHKSKNPEQTRLNLQSWLPQDLYPKINRLLVGFGQVICVPVGPRCDLCKVGQAGLCPSFNPPDAKAASKRIKVDLLDSDDEQVLGQADNWVKVKSEDGCAKIKVEVQVDGPDRVGTMQVRDLIETHNGPIRVKEENDHKTVDAVAVEKALEW